MSKKSDIPFCRMYVRQKLEIIINHTLQFTRMRRSSPCRDDFKDKFQEDNSF